MASPLGHSMMGVAIYVATVNPFERFKRWGWLFLLVLFSVAADLDYLPAAFGRLDLADMFHRKFTHTLLFAVLAVAIYVVVAVIRKGVIVWKAALILFMAMLIHLGIDIISLDENEPRGIAPIEPFSGIYLYSSIAIFPTVLKGSYADIFSLHNVKVALYEIFFFGVLIVLVLGFSALSGPRKIKD
jgi:membrane-bound metal-dependent hydrolase YbcI (DUF457 family)